MILPISRTSEFADIKMILYLSIWLIKKFQIYQKEIPTHFLLKKKKYSLKWATFFKMAFDTIFSLSTSLFENLAFVMS